MRLSEKNKRKNYLLLLALLLIPGFPLLCMNQFGTVKENYSVDTGKKVVHLKFSREFKARGLGLGWVNFMYGNLEEKRDKVGDVAIEKIILKNEKRRKGRLKVTNIKKFNERDRKKIVKELRTKLGKKDFKRLMKGKLQLARTRWVEAPWTGSREYYYGKKQALIYQGGTGKGDNAPPGENTQLISFISNVIKRDKKVKAKTEGNKEKSAADKKKEELARFKSDLTREFTLVFRRNDKKSSTTRLSSKVINSPYKDYNLIQSPREGDNHYYMLTNRPKDSKGPTNSRKALKIIRIKAIYSDKTGVDAFPGGTEFVKGLPGGDKVGFSMFHSGGKFYVVYSMGGSIYQSSSTDGLNFKGKRKLNVNSKAFERDPTISSDGKMIAFASNRFFLGYKELRNRGYLFMHTYIAFRSSPSGKFGKAIKIKDSLNLNGLSFPVIFRVGGKNFVLFHRNPRVNKASLCSSEIRDGQPLYPLRVKVRGVPALWKYLSMSRTRMRGRTLFVSYLVKAKNFDQAHVRIIKLKKAKSKLLDPLAEE